MIPNMRAALNVITGKSKRPCALRKRHLDKLFAVTRDSERLSATRTHPADASRLGVSLGESRPTVPPSRSGSHGRRAESYPPAATVPQLAAGILPRLEDSPTLP